MGWKTVVLILISSVLFVQKFVCNTAIYDFHYARIDVEYTYCFDLLKIKTSVQLRVATNMKVKHRGRGKTFHVVLKGIA
jgi:hypothetical protein